jgi:hypothetical protein
MSDQMANLWWIPALLLFAAVMVILRWMNEPTRSEEMKSMLMCESCNHQPATVWCRTPYGEFVVACSDCAVGNEWEIVTPVKSGSGK